MKLEWKPRNVDKSQPHDTKDTRIKDILNVKANGGLRTKHTRVIKELDDKSARNERSIRCACLFAIAYALRVQVQRTSSSSHNILIYLYVHNIYRERIIRRRQRKMTTNAQFTISNQIIIHHIIILY
jgi:hypothetical protein